MPCTNRDASLLTQKRRGIALKSYYDSWKAATVNRTKDGNQAATGPARTNAEVISEIYLGCQACNTTGYPFNPSAGGAGGLTGSS